MSSAGWLLRPDGLYLALLGKALHVKEQHRPGLVLSQLNSFVAGGYSVISCE